MKMNADNMESNKTSGYIPDGCRMVGCAYSGNGKKDIDTIIIIGMPILPTTYSWIAAPPTHLHAKSEQFYEK